ncbi:MAG: efflux RND transporter permease subunit, partial [Chitinophagales bacterium]
QFTLRTFGELGSVAELGSILVANRGGRQTFLGDVAKIGSLTGDLGAIVRVDGKPGVILSVQKQSGSNTVQVAGRVLSSLRDLRKRYPSLEIRPLDDNSVFIRQAVQSVAGNAVSGGVLAALILLFFLRSVWTTAIVAVAIPVAIVASFILIERAGMTLNTMSLGGLALGVGMLVDNSIVVLDNIHRHRDLGKDGVQAAIDGTTEMISAVTASTLTTVVVFLPMMYLSGMTGILFRQLSLMVAFSISCSLLVSLSLVPMLCSHLPPPKAPGRVSRVIEGWLEGLESRYVRTVFGIMKHPLLVGLSALGLFLGSLALVPLLGTEVLSSADEGQISIRLSLPTGTRLETTDEMVRRVETLVRRNVPELQSLIAQAGGGRGTASGDLTLRLVPSTARRRSTDEIVSDLRQRLALIPGLSSRVSARNSVAQRMMSGSLGGGADRITLNVQGQDRAVLKQVADDLVQVVGQVPGTANVGLSRSEGQPEFVVRVDRKRAADFGLTASQIANSVQAAVQGKVATQVRVDGQDTDVRVSAAGVEGLTPQEIEALPIPARGGTFIPLSSVATLVQQMSPSTLERLNQQATVSLTAAPDGRDLGSVVADIRSAVSRYRLSGGVNVYFSGEYEEQQRSFRELLVALALSVALVYIVMAAQFESLGDPFIVMFSVPFGFVGVVLALILWATPLTTQAFMGLIMLGGIVVNNAIVLIDYIHLLRQRGMGLDEAILEAARTRLRPILMTTGTTVLGLIPLALEIGEGAELQSPLARTVLGGLTASTLVTLVLIPTIYRVAHQKRARLKPVNTPAALLLAVALALGLGASRVEAVGLTVQEALAGAVKANYRVVKAQAKVETALSQLREAEAAYRPRFTLGNEWEVSGPLSGSEYDPLRGGVLTVSARRTLLARRSSLPVELARLALQAAERELAEETENVRLSVLVAYIALLKADLGVTSAELALTRATAAETELERRTGLGMASQADLIQVRAQRTAAELDSARAQNQRRLAQARLNQAMGRELSAPLTLADHALPEAVPEEPLGELRLQDRFDLFQLQNQLDRARLAAAGRTKNDALAVTVGGSLVGSQASAALSWGSGDGALDLTVQGDVVKFGDDLRATGSPSGRQPHWSLQVDFALPLYDGGVEREKARQEQVNLAQLAQALAEQERIAALEATEARLAWEEAKAQLAVKSLEADAAAERLRSAQARLALGAETSASLLDAELASVRAERAKKEALWDGFLALARLRKAFGRPVW